MKKLLSVAVVSAGFLALPVKASEVGLLIDKQFGEAQTSMVVINGIAVNNKVEAVKPVGFGIRGCFTVLDLKVAELGLTATYHPETKEDLKVNALGITAKIGEYKGSYMAVGAQMDWKLLLNLNAGVEIRRESLKTDLDGLGSSSTTYTRPWIRAGIGFSLPTPIVKPFIRLEAAYALKSADALNNNSSDDDFNKAMAPKFQIGLYGGVRF